MPTLEELLASSEAQGQGAVSVTSPASSPGDTVSAVTPDATSTGVPSVDDTPAPQSLEDMLSASQEQSALPAKESKGVALNYAGGFNGRATDVLHSAYWALKNATPIGIMEDTAKKAASAIKGTGYQSDTFGDEAKQRFAIKKALSENLGMSMSAEDDSLAGKIGRNTFDAVASLAGFMAAAPALAATQGYSTMDFLKRSFGESLVKHPWLATLSEVAGGAPGSTVGEEYAGAPGAMAGGVIGNVATLPVQGAVKLTTAAGKKLLSGALDAVGTLASKFGYESGEALQDASRAISGKVKPLPVVPDDVADTYRAAESKARAAGDNVVQQGQDYREMRSTATPTELVDIHTRMVMAKREEMLAVREADAAWEAIPKEARGKYSREAMAIRSEAAEVTAPQRFAEEQLTGDRALVQKKISDALRMVEPLESGVTAESYSGRIATGLKNAEQLASDIEGRYWQRVPLKEKIPSREQPLKDMDSYLRDAAGKYSRVDIPEDGVKRLRELFAPMNKQKMFQSLPTLQRLRGEISSLRGDRAKELASDAPNYRLIANQSRLEALANKWIGDAFPDNVPLQQARSFSNQYHDWFSKSEMFPLLARGGRGQDKVRAEDVLTQLLKRPKAMEDLYGMTEGLMNSKRIKLQPDAYPTALKPKDQGAVAQLQSDVENGIRQSFQEEVANLEADPLKVQKVVDKWTPRIKSFSKVTGELQQSMDQALKGVDERRAIETSSLAKYFEVNDPVASMNKIWSSPNAPKLARSLMTGEHGVAGFTKDPIALEGFRALATDKLFDAGRQDPKRIQELLSDGRIGRLMQTVLGSDRHSRLERIIQSSIEMEKDNTQGRFMQNAVWASRWAAVKFSALLPSFGRGGELQQAALFSEMAKRKVMSLMQGADPAKLFTEAVRNPSIEQLLYSKVGADKRSMEINRLLVRRVLRFDDGIRNSYDALQRHEGQGPKKEYPNVSDILSIGKANAQEQAAIATGNGLQAPPRVADPFNTKDKNKDQSRMPKGPQGNPFTTAQNIDDNAMSSLPMELTHRMGQHANMDNVGPASSNVEFRDKPVRGNDPIADREREWENVAKEIEQRKRANIPNGVFGPLAAKAGINDIGSNPFSRAAER